MKSKLLIPIILIGVLSYIIFLFMIYKFFPNIGRILIPFLLTQHLLSIPLAYMAYRGKVFKVPIIGNFAAKWSKIDDRNDIDIYKKE